MSGKWYTKRPASPDFWNVAEIVRSNDAAADLSSGTSIWTEVASKVADPDTLLYMGFQRAMRATGMRTDAEVEQNEALLERMALLWAEGFVTGGQFATRPTAEDLPTV